MNSFLKELTRQFIRDITTGIKHADDGSIVSITIDKVSIRQEIQLGFHNLDDVAKTTGYIKKVIEANTGMFSSIISNDIVKIIIKKKDGKVFAKNSLEPKVSSVSVLEKIRVILSDNNMSSLIPSLDSDKGFVEECVQSRYDVTGNESLKYILDNINTI